VPNDASNIEFHSVLAPFMDQFLQEKHACGYMYQESTRILHRLDDFLVQEGLATLELPRSIARNWLAKKPHESPITQQHRIILVRHFSRFLLRAGSVCARPHIVCSQSTSLCAQIADRRRASKVLSCSRCT
jgi:site-specific recombinase XerD